MPWIKLDDGLWRHPKIRKAWRRDPRAMGLHFLALSYCGEHYENDGFVPPEFVHDQLSGRAAEQVIGVLVDCRLWKPFGDGWQIHDFLTYNRSAQQIEAQREAKRLAGSLGGRAKHRAKQPA